MPGSSVLLLRFEAFVLSPEVDRALACLRHRLGAWRGDSFPLDGWPKASLRGLRPALVPAAPLAISGWPTPWACVGVDVQAPSGVSLACALDWGRRAAGDAQRALRRSAPEATVLCLWRAVPQLGFSRVFLGHAHLSLPTAARHDGRFWSEAAEFDDSVLPQGWTKDQWEREWASSAARDVLIRAALDPREDLGRAMEETRARLRRTHLARALPPAPAVTVPPRPRL